MAMINYAHRGCSEFYPENTLYSFYMGLSMKADGIETDIQRTKDGVLVLFHDNDLKRICGREGSICDYTYAELLEMDFGIFKGEAFRGERIVTLREFLLHFSKKALTFALEIKQTGIEEEVLSMLREFAVTDKVIITSFDIEAVRNAKKADGSVRLGYLTKDTSDQVLSMLKEEGITQYCPQIASITRERFDAAVAMGLSVRFWGVGNAELMQKALSFGGDGMTINDPSALSRALGRL